MGRHCLEHRELSPARTGCFTFDFLERMLQYTLPAKFRYREAVDVRSLIFEWYTNAVTMATRGSP